MTNVQHSNEDPIPQQLGRHRQKHGELDSIQRTKCARTDLLELGNARSPPAGPPKMASVTRAELLLCSTRSPRQVPSRQVTRQPTRGFSGGMLVYIEEVLREEEMKSHTKRIWSGAGMQQV